jgi:sulfide:quinone oxidoreductase
MSPKPLTPDLAVSPQLTLADLNAAARLGFRTIIDNRPDGEEPGQPTAAALGARARMLGLHFLHQPVVAGRIGAAEVEAFAAALRSCARPALAFCRTGARSTTLWALSRAGRDQATPCAPG